MNMHGKQIKHAEVNIGNKWVHARVTKFDYDPKKWGETEYMVVFRNSEGGKDITYHKYESLALDKYQEFLEKHFLDFAFKRKIEAQISNCENYLYDPQ